MRAVRILPAAMQLTPGRDGVFYARAPQALGAYPNAIVERLELWASRTPDRPFLVERQPEGGRRQLTFGAALSRTRTLAQALLDRHLSVDRPLAILSGNSIEHALMALAAMYAGVPYAPLAPSYSLISRDYSALRALMATLQPGLVFAADGPAFERAIEATVAPAVEVVSCVPLATRRTVSLAELEDTPARGTVDEARARVTPGTIAKVLFTSGSTGSPKGVINTQRMLCANQEQIRTVMPFLSEEPLVLSDWLPWNHTFGGNHNFGIVLYNGGTLHIDHGRPVPGAFDATVATLREVAATAYFNVPKGFEMLLPALKADAALRSTFFSRLQILFYAAAGLRQQIADEFVTLAIETCGERIPWVTGLGATESAPFAISTGAQMAMTSKIGVPVPGVELKVAPVGDRLEARLRGPNITPGYWRDEALTRAAFDDEGFYRMGDAIAFADPRDLLQGFVFQGRIAEDFKLSTGTWVRVGALRVKLLAALGDLVQDVAITGHDRDVVGALLFPNLAAWRARADAAGAPRALDATGAQHAAPSTTLVRHLFESGDIRAELEARLSAFTAANPGSSTAPGRVAILETAPSLDAAEITDKGSLNQRAVLAARRDIVDQLYGADGDALILDIPQKGSQT